MAKLSLACSPSVTTWNRPLHIAQWHLERRTRTAKATLLPRFARAGLLASLESATAASKYFLWVRAASARTKNSRDRCADLAANTPPRDERIRFTSSLVSSGADDKCTRNVILSRFCCGFSKLLRSHSQQLIAVMAFRVLVLGPALVDNGHTHTRCAVASFCATQVHFRPEPNSTRTGKPSPYSATASLSAIFQFSVSCQMTDESRSAVSEHDRSAPLSTAPL